MGRVGGFDFSRKVHFFDLVLDFFGDFRAECSLVFFSQKMSMHKRLALFVSYKEIMETTAMKLYDKTYFFY